MRRPQGAVNKRAGSIGSTMNHAVGKTAQQIGACGPIVEADCACNATHRKLGVPNVLLRCDVIHDDAQFAKCGEINGGRIHHFKPYRFP